MSIFLKILTVFLFFQVTFLFFQSHLVCFSKANTCFFRALFCSFTEKSYLCSARGCLWGCRAPACCYRRVKGNPVRVRNYPRSCKFLYGKPLAARSGEKVTEEAFSFGKTTATWNKPEDLPLVASWAEPFG